MPARPSLLLPLALLLAVSAQPARAESVPPVGSFSFPGGTQVFTSEDHRRPRVAVQVWLDLGMRDDWPGYRGVGRAVLAGLSKGAKRSMHQAIGAAVGKGANVSTGTSAGLESTAFKMEVPAAKLDAALHALGDVICKPDWSTISAEEACKAAAGKKLDLSSAEEASRYLQYALLGPTLGWPNEDFNPKFTRSDLEGYWDQRYTGDRLKVVVAGDFDTGTVVGRVLDSFAPLVDKHDAGAGFHPERPDHAPDWKWTDKRTVVGFALRRPGPEPRLRAANEVYAHLLEARLTAALQEPEIATAGNFTTYELREAQVVVGSVLARPDAVTNVESGIRKLVADMASENVGLDEFAKSIKWVAEENTMRLDDMQVRAAAIGRSAIRTAVNRVSKNPGLELSYPDVIRQVSRQNVREAAANNGLEFTRFPR